MKIIEWFDPKNVDHLKAYRHLQDNGLWPEGFIPENMEFMAGWQIFIASSMADEWIQYKLGNQNDRK